MIKRQPSCADVHLSVAFFHLAHLLDAGLTIDDALEDLESLESIGRMKKVWRGLVSEVRGGNSLSSAMCYWPKVFSPSIRAVVGAGEAAGRLTIAIHEVEAMLSWQAELRGRLAAVLAYPVFAILVLLFVVFFLFTSVVPSLSDYLHAGDADLSWHTQSALVLSRTMVNLTWLRVLLIVFLVVLVSTVLCTATSLRRIRDALIIKTPLIGELLRSLWVSRYCQLVGQLYKAGVPLIDAMGYGEKAIGNQILLARWTNARHSIHQGTTLTNAFVNEPLVPLLFQRLIAVGESSGKLDVALLRCSEQLRRYTLYRIERVEKLTGPFMLCVVGLLLLWIVVSVLSPVYRTAIEVVVQ